MCSFIGKMPQKHVKNTIFIKVIVETKNLKMSNEDFFLDKVRFKHRWLFSSKKSLKFPYELHFKVQDFLIISEILHILN